MADKRDYYEVLGVDRNAGADEIKLAYRRRAMKYHPDNYKGDKADGERRFKELAEAYEVLCDPDKRQRYDRFGHAGLAEAGVHDFTNMGFGDIFSMFEDIFGGMGFSTSRRAADRGYDLETQIELSLEQVAAGVDHTLEFDRMDVCETCGGSGCRPGTQPRKCETCGGRGQVQQQVRSFFGMSVRIVACPTCRGRGTRVTDPCEKCNGSGRAKAKRVLAVHIPAGVHDGQVIRLRGEGEPGQTSTQRGDLHCYVSIKPHPLLTRHGNDLICQVPVSFTQAVLGGKVHVPTLAGMDEIDVPAGSQNGDVVTLKGRGLPGGRARRAGDQHVQVFIEVPKKLTRKQKEMLREYAETEKKNVTPNRKKFFKKLKEYFSPDK